MDNNKFTKEDKQKVIEFLNFIASTAEFKMNTNQVIAYFKLLNFMQQSLLPKIEANIFELERIIEEE
jgi:hypothetical protein